MKNKIPLISLLISLMIVGNLPFSQSLLPDGYRHGTMSAVKIFDNTVWWINKGTGPAVQAPMTVFLNGVNQGTTYLLEFGHQNGSQWPEVAAIYNTGYLRLTPPGRPFGTSFILGPGYWGNDNIYVHNVQISRIDIDTTGAIPNGPIQLTIHARDYSSARWPEYYLEITYQATLPDPDTDSTQMAITESFNVAKAFTLSTSRQALHEGFKWVQFSSMYINSDYHDSDSAVHMNSNGKIQYVKFSDIGCNANIFQSPATLSSQNPWAELIHWDDAGWQGNTPNTIVDVNSPSLVGQITAQGYITCTTDENDDNVSMWLNHDAASLSFQVGNSGSIAYTLTSQDPPKMPPLTFADVPLNHMFWKYIEAFYDAGLTTGCSPAGQAPKIYCPYNNVTRAEMAVFIERAMGNFNPTPSPAGHFSDVLGTFWAAKFIDEYYNDGITTGCAKDPLRYCPDNNVTRQEMAVFIERALGNFNPSPNPTGIFSDVPYPGMPSTFPAFIDQFYNDGITTGCAANPLRYCPLNLVTRQEMAVFIVRAFGIPLP